MPKHYLICQHGLLGTSSDFTRLVEHFVRENPETVSVVLLASNENITHTLNGIEAAGERCVREIIAVVDEILIDSNGVSVSFLGHSMGGLFLRYALRKIYRENPSFWEDRRIRLSRAFFIATPHCGTMASSWIIQMGAQYLLRHLFKSINDISMGTSFLETIADADGIGSLKKFGIVLLYANLYSDQLVSTSSALALPRIRDMPRLNNSLTVQIKEYPSSDSDSWLPDDVLSPQQMAIIQGIGTLTNISRYLVIIPSRLPSFLQRLDNSAHTKIICHALLDRRKVGMPIIEHIASFFP